MGKKVVVRKDGTVKKKRSCCCSCFLVVFVVSLVLLVGGTVVGCIFLDKFTKNKFDMSLKECFGVVTSLYGAKEKDIVDNAYSATDMDGFESEFKKQLFLQESAELDVLGAVEDAMKLLSESSEETPLEQAVSTLTKQSNAGATDGTDTETSGNGTTDGSTDIQAEKDSAEKLLDFITGLVDPDAVDYERLAAYTDEQYDEYCFTLTDKELAAFLNEILKVMLDAEGVKGKLAETMGQLGITSVDDAARLRQVKFGMENTSYRTETGAWSSDKKDVAVAYVTLQVRVDNVVTKAAEKHIPNGFLSGLAAFGGRAILPNNLYVTVGLGLSDDIGARVYLNKIDNSAKMQSAFKLVNGITKLTGKSFDAEQYLNDTVSQKVNPILDKMGDMADFSKMSEHTFLFDTYGTLAGLVDTSDDEDKLTGPQLLGTVSSLSSSQPYTGNENLKPEHRYDIWYEKDGVRYTADDPARPDGARKVDYELAFMEQMDEKYLIDVFVRDEAGNTVIGEDGKPVVAEGRSFAELVKAFGMDGGDTDLVDLINMNRFGQISGGDKTENDLRINLTDKMLGAIIAKNLSTLGRDAIEANGLELKVVQMAVIKDGETDWANISVEVDMNSLFEGLGGLGSFAAIFLPKQIVMTVSADITLDRPAEERLPAAIRYNAMTAAETADMLAVMEKFGVSGFDTASITAMVAEPVNEILDNMNKAIFITIEPSKLTELKNKPENDGSDKFNDVSDDENNMDVALPSVYEILAKNVFADKDPVTGAPVYRLSGEAIKDVFDVLYAYDNDSPESAALVNALKEKFGGSAAVNNYEALQGELADKYYLKTGTPVTTFEGLLAAISSVDGEFDVNKYDIEKMKADNRAAEELRPVFSEAELAYLFAEKLADTVDGQLDFTVLQVNTVKGANAQNGLIKALIEIDMSRMLGDRASLMPVEKIYVTLTVDMGDVQIDDTGKPYSYNTTFAVNRPEGVEDGEAGVFLTATEQENLIYMINKFSGDGMADLDKITADVGQMLYERFGEMAAKLGGTPECVDNGIQFISFYDFLSGALGLVDENGNPVDANGNPTTDYGADKAAVSRNLQAAVQGMYAGTPDAFGRYNYDEATLLFNRIATEDLGIKQAYNDTELGYALAKAMTGKTTAKLVQTVVLPANMAHDTARTFVKSYKGQALTDSNLVILTFEMDLAEFIGGENSQNSFVTALMPQKLYASVLLVHTADGYEEQWFRINNMSEQHQKVLLRVADMNKYGDVETGLSGVCKTALSAFTNVEFGPADPYMGVGKVTIG